MWSSAALPAIIAAAVTIVVNAGLSRVWTLLVVAWRFPQADHLTLVSEGTTIEYGGQSSFRCVVRCAPARKIRRRRRVDHGAASDLVAKLMPALPAAPDFYDRDSARFQMPLSASEDRQAWVNIRASGLIEVSGPIADSRDGASTFLALEDVAENIGAAVDYVRCGGYRKIFGTRRRLDWAVSISGYVQDRPTAQTRAWTGLTVGGRVLGGRATSQQPGAALGSQFGQQTLKSRRQRTGGEEVAREVLADWLDRSGYWQPAAAIEQAMAELRARPAAPDLNRPARARQ